LKFDAVPWGLEGVLQHIKHRYNNPPIYILENGTLHSLLSSGSVFVYLKANLLVLKILQIAPENKNRFTDETRFDATRHTKS